MEQHHIIFETSTILETTTVSGIPRAPSISINSNQGEKGREREEGGPLTDTFLERNIRNFRGEKKEGNLVR